jgi:hypothetical protein
MLERWKVRTFKPSNLPTCKRHLNLASRFIVNLNPSSNLMDGRYPSFSFAKDKSARMCETPGEV